MATRGALPDAELFVKAVDEAAAAYKAAPSEASRIKLKEASLTLFRSLESIPEAALQEPVRSDHASRNPHCYRGGMV